MQIDIKDVSKLRALIFKTTRLSKKQTADIPFSSTEMNILGHLDRNGKLLPSELAELEHVSAQAVSQNINNLNSAGFINKQSDVSDKRKTWILLSAYGKTKLSEIKGQRDAWLLESINARLNDNEIEALINIVPILEKITNS